MTGMKNKALIFRHQIKMTGMKNKVSFFVIE